MSDIVIELKRRNWSNARIARELGMKPDEVLRLSQVTGLAEMFADKEFSEAWEPAVFKVYKHFESKSFLNLPYQKELPEIPARIQKHFCEILEVYLPFPTEELEKMVKNEFPWQNARRGLQEQESSRKAIAIQDMMDFYSEKRYDSSIIDNPDFSKNTPFPN